MTTTTEPAPIYSLFGGDPDMAELVEMFVEEMPDRIAALTHSLAGGDLDTLMRTAHQMKGSVGSYGFDVLTAGAAALERTVKEGQSESQIRGALDELIQLCQRVRAGQPN